MLRKRIFLLLGIALVYLALYFSLITLVKITLPTLFLVFLTVMSSALTLEVFEQAKKIINEGKKVYNVSMLIALIDITITINLLIILITNNLKSKEAGIVMGILFAIFWISVYIASWTRPNEKDKKD